MRKITYNGVPLFRTSWGPAKWIPERGVLDIQGKITVQWGPLIQSKLGRVSWRGIVPVYYNGFPLSRACWGTAEKWIEISRYTEILKVKINSGAPDGEKLVVT